VNSWDIVYESCLKDMTYLAELENAKKQKRIPNIPEDALFFPERLTPEFLAMALGRMGSFKFANQYLNEVFPSGQNPLKKEWLRYYKELPKTKFTFAMIDPAISQSDDADYTALVVIDVDHNGDWYLRVANRYRMTPSEIVNKVFEVQSEFSPLVVGIEDVAFQKALLYMMSDEMRRRNIMVPVTGIRPDNDKSKHTRIMGLVPRFEWGRIFLNHGLNEFELEYSQYVGERSAHDDLLDALAHCEKLINNSYPKEEALNYDKLSANHPEYEKHYIANLYKRAKED
jgi:predicted phage terminase large subunit-like protein